MSHERSDPSPGEANNGATRCPLIRVLRVLRGCFGSASRGSRNQPPARHGGDHGASIAYPEAMSDPGPLARPRSKWTSVTGPQPGTGLKIKHSERLGLRVGAGILPSALCPKAVRGAHAGRLPDDDQVLPGGLSLAGRYRGTRPAVPARGFLRAARDPGAILRANPGSHRAPERRSQTRSSDCIRTHPSGWRFADGPRCLCRSIRARRSQSQQTGAHDPPPGIRGPRPARHGTRARNQRGGSRRRAP